MWSYYLNHAFKAFNNFFIHIAGGIAVLIGKKFDCLIKNTTMDPPRRFVL